MRLIDIHCKTCGKVTRDYVVGDTELSFDLQHECPECRGTAMRMPNTARLRGGRKGSETRTYLDGTKRKGFQDLLMADDLRQRAFDSMDDGETARLHAEADKIEASKSTGQE